MIPATTPFVAHFNEHARPGGGRTIPTTKPVIAWDDDGRALVVDDKTGRLTRADSYKNFGGVEQATSSYVTAVPGGGWRLAWKQTDGTEYMEPVLAWAIDGNGYGQAISADADGLVDTVESHDGNPRFIPPVADVEDSNMRTKEQQP